MKKFVAYVLTFVLALELVWQPIFMAGLFLAFPSVAGATTFNAVTCGSTDVQNAINLTSNGDTVAVPAGTCVWGAGVNTNKCISIIGAGVPNNLPSQLGSATNSTTILDQFNNSSTPLIAFNGVAQAGCSAAIPGQYVHVSMLAIVPCNGSGNPSPCTGALTNGGPPMSLYGVETTSGAPFIRIDNISFTGFSNSANGSGTNGKILIDNFFGVIDHTTCIPLAGSGSIECSNLEMSNYMGVPAGGTAGYGDNSWTQPWPGNADSTQIYLENNNWQYGTTESEFPPKGQPGFGGGGRFESRFNSYAGGSLGAPFLTCHGTDTSGRARLGCKYVSLEDTFVWNSITECNGDDVGPFNMRDGIALAFGGNVSCLGGATTLTFLLNIQHQRCFRDTGYGRCGGSVYDALDNRVDTGPWVIGTVSGSTIPITTSPWTSGAFTLNVGSPGANIWLAWDATTDATAFVLSNTANSLTVGGFTSFGLNGLAFTNGGQIRLTETTLYGAFTHTGSNGASTPTSSVSYTASQWVNSGSPYSLCNVTQGFCSTIATNSGTAFTYDATPTTNTSSAQTWNTGDVGVITRAPQTLDDPGRAMEQAIQSTPGVQVPLPLIPTASLVPPHIIATTLNGLTIAHPVKLESNQSLRYLANRNYFIEPSNQTAQTSCPTGSTCTPFNGTTGDGHGTLALRPTTCTTGVGYWATDQGSWNTTAGSNPASYSGQGKFYTCTATNTWGLTYTPYTYPHPLTAVGGGTPTAPSPVSSMFAWFVSKVKAALSI